MAIEAGFKSVHALPMRLRGVVIGAANLFQINKGNLSDADLIAGQALADVATIAIHEQRSAHETRILIDQLNQALNSRIVIEQAKGMVAERTGLDMEQAFVRLRKHARNHNLLLSDVAQAVIDLTLMPAALDTLRRS